MFFRGLMLLAVVALVPSSCEHQEPENDVANQTTHTGILRSGIMAIGGETTGWELADEQGRSIIEVDVSQVWQQAEQHDGQRVIITGSIVERGYVERGRVPTLQAQRIESAGP